jgi:hypothetical protein
LFAGDGRARGKGCAKEEVRAKGGGSCNGARPLVIHKKIKQKPKKLKKNSRKIK